MNIQDSEELENAAFVATAVSQSVCLLKYPKSVIELFVTVLDNDGGGM